MEKRIENEKSQESSTVGNDQKTKKSLDTFYEENFNFEKIYQDF